MTINQREEALVLAAQNGDTNAFEELYQLYYDKIYALIMMTVKNSADTEDILQLTFIKAWQNITKLNDPRAFNTWLQRIALNESKSMLRKKRPDLSVDDEGENGEILQFESDLLLPQEYAERDDLSARLRKIIEELSVVQRDTILLFYYNEMSVEEIAQIMDCSEGTVKSRLFLARKAIKTEIEEQERKSGEKFYGAVLMPFGPVFNSFVRSKALSPEAALQIWGAIHQSITGTAAAATGTAATTAVAKTGLSLGAKIAIGVIAGIALIGGAAFGISQLFKPQEPSVPSSASSVAASSAQADETQEAAEETQAPATEAPTEADHSKAFSDYLRLLIDHEAQIKAYVNEPNKYVDHGIVLRPIAFIDLVGDDTPEMVYIKQIGETNGTLCIESYKDGSVTEIFNDAQFATRVSHGPRYFLFASDDTLYAESVNGGKDTETYNFYRFDSDDSGKLRKNLMMTGKYTVDDNKPVSFTINDAEVSQEQFEQAKDRLVGTAARLVMDNREETVYSKDDATLERLSKLDDTAMTYEEAIKFLGGNAAEKDQDNPGYAQEDLDAIKGKYSLYYRPGLAEITSDGKLIIHSMDIRTGEEADVNTYQITEIRKIAGSYNVDYQKDGEQDYFTVYMKGDVSPGGLPPEYVDGNNCLKEQLLRLSNKGVPFIYFE
ncbi:RNA polymerase sigma factor [Ruminococcus sp.]|uniref:RNA polymerase sigma factor n=1 Tax=Ruminococcus sp. TaxID=41978 RepID=UPI00386D718F